jgi:hypothetical protein
MVVPDVAVTAVADSGFVRAQPCRDLLAGTIFVIGWGADELH